MALMGTSILAGTLAVLFLILFCYRQNNRLVVSRYEYRSPKVPVRFDGFQIVHISDLHNKNYKGRLLSLIQKQSPDIIAVTGDLIDRRRTDLETAMAFAGEAAKISPAYYVSGNHEAWSGLYGEIKTGLERAGVEVVDDRRIALTRSGETVFLLGVSDPGFLSQEMGREASLCALSERLGALAQPEGLQVLLVHRPDLIALYEEKGVDLVLAGHAHGGQVRLPWIKGLLGPDQGWFPRYTEGVHTLGKTTMVISRGLGNSLFPLRLFNPPEVVSVTLRSEEGADEGKNS